MTDCNDLTVRTQQRRVTFMNKMNVLSNSAEAAYLCRFVPWKIGMLILNLPK